MGGAVWAAYSDRSLTGNFHRFYVYTHREDRSAVLAKMRAKGLAYRKDVALHLQGRGGLVLAQEKGLGKWASEELSALLHSVRG